MAKELSFVDLFKDLEKYVDNPAGLAPNKYLVAVEKGIRSYCYAPNVKVTMGVGPKKVLTQEMYANIAPWRKIECYITAVRFRLGQTAYSKWEDYKWEDYIQRKILQKTFVKRHLPLSDGLDHFNGKLKSWPAVPPKVVKRQRKSSSTRKKNVKVVVENEPEPQNASPMKFDPTTGNFVPYVDVTSSDVEK